MRTYNTKRVFAGTAAAICMLAAQPARADNWGCEVLLCLSNPAGPMAVAACVPPITRLWNALRKFRPDPFPTCDMARYPDTSAQQGGGPAFAQLGQDYFDVCPKGTTMFEPGVPPSGNADNYDAGTPRVCAVKLLGTRTEIVGTGDSYSTIEVPVYEGPVYLQANASPNVIDVYITEAPNPTALYQRVRY